MNIIYKGLLIIFIISMIFLISKTIYKMIELNKICNKNYKYHEKQKLRKRISPNEK